MTFKYKREFSVLGLAFILCFSIVGFIKTQFFKDKKIDEPIGEVVAYYGGTDKQDESDVLVKATTKNVRYNTTTIVTYESDEELINEVIENPSIPYEIAPTFIDDGSIIYDGMTLTELTDKLNKSLSGYLTNTGYFFAKYTMDTGMNPYLNLAITLLETGCQWTCSSLTVKCNNFGGLKGGPSCNGTSYKSYDTLEEGLDGYLSILYNNYYLKGMTTPETMASTYAASDQWCTKVRNYMSQIEAK